jgi:putative lipoic acid-binding regulatory protein
MSCPAAAGAGVDVLNERISWKHSSNGKYVSVRIAFKADSREQYDAHRRCATTRK